MATMTAAPAMTAKARVQAALSGEPIDHVPVSLWGHEFLREWSAEELAASTVELWRPYQYDFIKFNPRATYFAEAWGSRFERPAEQRQPRLIQAAITSVDGLRALRPVDARSGVFAEHLSALRMVIANAGDAVDVVHTVFSPLSVAAMLSGWPVSPFLEMARSDGPAAHAAIGAVAETLVEYAGACIEAGASGIFFAPLTWASRDTCDEAFYDEFGRPYDLRVLEAVAGAPFNILHVCRNNNMLMSLLDYPVAAFNWADRGEGNPSLADVKARTSKAVMGGIDHASLHRMTAADVTAQGREAIASAGRERLLLTGGCAIAPQTPAENRAAVVAAARA